MAKDLRDFKNINFGCGTDLKIGFLNIDISTPDNFSVPDDSMFSVFDMLDAQTLPKEHYDSIVAEMIFEHIHPDLIPTTIYTMACCLKVGGVITVTVPDFDYFTKYYDPPKRINIDYVTFMREAMFQLLDPCLKLNSKNRGRGHQSLWTKLLAQHWFGSEGFEVVFIEPSVPGILQFNAVKINRYTNPYTPPNPFEETRKDLLAKRQEAKDKIQKIHEEQEALGIMLPVRSEEMEKERIPDIRVRNEEMEEEPEPYPIVHKPKRKPDVKRFISTDEDEEDC